MKLFETKKRLQKHLQEQNTDVNKKNLSKNININSSFIENEKSSTELRIQKKKYNLEKLRAIKRNKKFFGLKNPNSRINQSYKPITLLLKRIMAKKAPHWTIGERKKFIKSIDDFKNLQKFCNSLISANKKLIKKINDAAKSMNELNEYCDKLAQIDKTSKFGNSCKEMGDYLSNLGELTAKGYKLMLNNSTVKAFSRFIDGPMKNVQTSKDEFRFAKAKLYFCKRKLDKYELKNGKEDYDISDDKIAIALLNKIDSESMYMKKKRDLIAKLNDLNIYKESKLVGEILKIDKFGPKFIRNIKKL